MLDLEGDLKRSKGFKDGFVVAGVGPDEDGEVKVRCFEKNPGGSECRLDWREASLSDLPRSFQNVGKLCGKPKENEQETSSEDEPQLSIVGLKRTSVSLHNHSHTHHTP